MTISHTDGRSDPAASPRSARRGLREVAVLLAAGAGLVAVAPALEASAATPAAAYCSPLSASKVSAIVGGAVKFVAAAAVKTSLECEYTGTSIVTLLKETGIPKSALATRSKAEATALTGFPAGTKVVFSALSALGATGFSWTATIEGHQFAGVGENKGTTGYGAEMLGKPDISKLERLIALAIAD
jgi:hypothetical protein